MFVEAEVINLGVFKDEYDCLVNPNQFHRQTNVIFTNAKKTQIRSFRVSQLGFLIAVIAMFAIAPHECFANNMGKNLDVIKFRGGLSSPLSMSSAPVAELRTPPNMFSNAVDIGIAKANLGLIKIFILGILSGCHIAFGAFLMLSVGGACPGLAAANPGLQKIISGMFGLPFGLMMTVIGGGELFTGNTAVVGAALLEKKIKFQQLLKSWFFSYVGNFVGSVLLAYLVFGGALPVGPQSMASAVAKTSMTFQAAFIRGILCNWLVCMAVYMSTGASSLAGKMTAIFFPISAFIALGLEHSVANMFIIPVGMLFGAEVSVADMLLKNLLPVTLGNIVSGAGCVALGYAASYGNSTSKLFSLPRGGFSNQKPNFLTKMIGFTKDFTKRMIKTSSSRLDDTKRTGSSYLPAEALERAKVGNNVEKIKQKVDPVTMWDDVHDYAAAIRAGTTSWEEIGTDKIDFLVKYAGMFHRKKATPGKFMMRLRIPNGLVTSSQMHYFGDAVKPYGPSIGVVDITTRMNIQLRSPPLEDAADIVKELQKRGLTSLMSGLDNLRNMVGSPIAGIDPHEIYDTRELNKQIDNWYTNNGLGNPEWANMPRKFNIAVSGTRDDFSHTIINDIGLQACPHAVTGEMGFNVVLGGYISIKRIAEAIPMNAWIPASDALNLCKAILTLFRDEGSRGDRQKTRLMWLIETKTLPVFIDMVAAQMASYKGLATYTFESVQTHKDEWTLGHRHLVGVHPQKQAGLSWIGVHVPVGRLSPEECHQIADIADKYSNGEIRLTVDQNVLFPNIKNEHVAEFLKESCFNTPGSRLSLSPGHIVGHVVSCTGSQFCPLALVETKIPVDKLARKLESLVELHHPVRIHMTGCPNSCGQAQLADIGLMGAPARKADATGAMKAVPGVNIYLGGTIGEHAAVQYKPFMEGIPLDDLTDVLVKLLVEKFEGKLKQAV